MPGLPTPISRSERVRSGYSRFRSKRKMHRHDDASSVTRRLALSALITLAFAAGGLSAGVLSRSLAPMSDAGHHFADVLALALSWYGLSMARRPSTSERTFGYHRVGILTATVNAISLVFIAILIFWEAISRLRTPEPVASTTMIVVALIAIVINV